MPGQEWSRDKQQVRLDYKGMNTIMPQDLMPTGKYPYAQNVRAYIRGGIVGRTTQASLYSLGTGPVTDLRYMNDYFNSVDPAFQYLFARVSGVTSGQGGAIHINGGTAVAAPEVTPFGSMLPFRPANSPQPWMYIYSGGSTVPGIQTAGLYKVRSDGTVYNQGIAEPQVAPGVSVGGAGNLSLIAQYAYVYRSSITGATSNPSPLSAQLVLNNELAFVTATPSPDPQVDFIDFYRVDLAGTGALANLTYVGSHGNVAGEILGDNSPDLTIAANPTISYANFEPFPTVGLPINLSGNWTQGGPAGLYSGVFTVTGGGALPANLLPGTSVIMYGIGGTTISRPIGNTVQITLSQPEGNVSGASLSIRNPVLAATPLPWAWGPTDNSQFIFACGDPTNPGRLYWTTGNNPDASADTNTLDITSGSEILMNGCIVGGIGMVFSNQRAWLLYPNFFNATATAAGVIGTPWSAILSIATRGLIARRALTTDGGGNAYFVSTDGVYMSPGGNGAQIISGDIDNLFPHEGNQTSVPAPIVRGGQTIYPPAYGALDQMSLRMSGPFLYFDHINSTGAPQTLVYDSSTAGWTLDVYADPVTVHGWEDLSEAGAFADERPVCGTIAGNIYSLTIAGTENCTAIVAMASDNAGDARADKQWGDIYIRAGTDAGNNINIAAYGNLYQTAITIDPTTITGPTAEQGYIIDIEPPTGPFGGIPDTYARDLGTVLSWLIGHNTFITVWQPSFTPAPETIDARGSMWDNAGTMLNKWVQGFLLEADTSGQVKQLYAVGDNGDLAFPSEPVMFNGRSVQAFSFPIPMITHQMRLDSQNDEVPYRLYNLQWIWEPYPEQCMNWVSEPTSHGFLGWQHLREMNIGHRSVTDLTLIVTPDFGPSSSYIIPASFDIVTKTKVTIDGPNKFKVMQYAITSTAPFYLFLGDIECKIGTWGRTGTYQQVKPFGGPSKLGALV